MEYYEHPDYKKPHRYTFGAEETKEYIIHCVPDEQYTHHREDGPAIECPEEGNRWFLWGKEVDPEKVVDLWLARNIYCSYNRETDSLEFE
jgi:hypothetical protein